MSGADSENGRAGGLTPINLIDCGLEDLVTALLHGQPIATPEGGPPFVLENDNARRIFAYYTRHRDLWPRANFRRPDIALFSRAACGLNYRLN